MSAPLSGYRIIELAGIGPGPYAGQLLAEMGAEVICVQRPDFIPPVMDTRGKKSIVVDLRKSGSAQIILDLVKDADVLFESFRPGVTERLGVGPEACHAVNPKLVYGRITGWGQTGPWAKTAGHDINYISITGALAAMGHPDSPPPPPLNLVGDYGGGSLFLVNGILAALLKAEKTGQGEIIDAAIIDGVSSMMGLFYGLSGMGQWQVERGRNMLDGAWPFYRCYETADGKYMAVGCLEPQFFALMLEKLDISPEDYGAQYDQTRFADQISLLERVFKSKSRDDWAAIFSGTDACVSPVLDYEEATHHPHNIARGGLQSHGQFTFPRPAPGFSSTELKINSDIPQIGADTKAVLSQAGYTDAHIATLLADKVIKG